MSAAAWGGEGLVTQGVGGRSGESRRVRRGGACRPCQEDEPSCQCSEVSRSAVRRSGRDPIYICDSSGCWAKKDVQVTKNRSGASWKLLPGQGCGQQRESPGRIGEGWR